MGSAEREAEVFVPWLLQAHAQVIRDGRLVCGAPLAQSQACT